MKKRIASILLAVMMIVTLLPLGLVDTAWAAETQDAQRKAVTERAQAYIAACNSFSAQNGQSIPYWTISDAEFEGYVQTKTRDKAAETSKLKKQVDAGDFISALTTKTCTGSNGSHQWGNEKYTCRSHYFSGLDNRGGGYSQCQGFANYMAYVLFGEAGTSESNFTKMTQVGYGFDFQPGDVLRVLDGDKNGHSMVVYEGSGSSAKVIECNWGHSSRGYCNVRWDLTVAQKQKQFPTVETVWRPNASLAVTPGGTDSGGGTTGDVIGCGNCDANGANVTWKLTSDGTLTISGTGEMADYEWEGTPWYDLRSQVKTIIIKRGVTSIGSYGFSNCNALTSVMIPSGVTDIGAYAFSGCKALSSVTIPSSVEGIGYSLFSDCDMLTDVYYEGYGADWLAAGGNCVPDGVAIHFKDNLYAKGECTGDISWSLSADGTLTVSGTGDMTDYSYSNTFGGDFGSYWCDAPWYRFHSRVKNVVIEGGVTSIGDGAFYHFDTLTSATIPNSVTSIGNCAFDGCTRLTDVTIPNSVTSIGGFAFRSCDSLISVVIPEGITDVDGDLFYKCTGLKSVTIPISVTKVDDLPFYGCEALTDIYYGGYRVDWLAMVDSAINESKVNIHYKDNLYGKGSCGENINWLMTAGGTLTISGTGAMGDYEWDGAPWYSVKLQVKFVVIEDGVTSIGSAFSGCKALTSVTIPKSVTYISEKAFYCCDSLTDVYYDGTASDWAKITIEEGNEPLTNATLHCAKSTPAAPVVKIGNSASSGKPQLTWRAVYGATSYRIYRSTSKGSGYSLLGTTTATSYTNTGAKAGTTYYYRVKAVNDAGLSPYSNIVSGQSKAVTPKLSAPVVKIGHSASSGKPMLTWNAVSGATSYKVYRATSQNGTYSLLGTVTTTSYTNTGAKAGTTYWYKVKAVNSAGESAYSNIVSGRATVTTLTLGHSSTSGKPQLTWKAVSGAASYKVYRATAKNGAYSVINTTKALTYTNTGAALGTTYYYKVEALNASGKSMGFSAIVEGKVAPVLAVGYSSVSGKPQLTWKAVPGATEYQVYRSTQQNSGYTKINTTTSTSYVNTGAKAGTTYYYKIVAVKGTAASDFSNIVSARPGK